MEIDVLEYELQYKYNQKILDLLEAYKTSEEFLKCKYKEDKKKQDTINASERKHKRLVNICYQLSKDLERALDDLSDLHNIEKNEILQYVKDAIKNIEKVSKELSNAE